ncbi:MAG TPA: ribosome biogenesis GTPase YlqF [Syntrophomonadaceae bacterium]|nr:ribosome biogenesis GTPase YlqF [Syntrophomonadaceae bacterium]
MGINWYPGHMVRARREIEENIKLVDVVVLLLDARAPFSCRNLELEALTARKSLIMVLNKKDLADPSMTRKYLDLLKTEGWLAVATDSLHGQGNKPVIQAISQAYKPLAQAMLDKGRRVRAARIMVAGVPNTGKSSFLNNLVGKKIAITGAKPGVTRGKQWIRIREDMEFLDTPGLMWPKIKNPEQGLKLALLDIVGSNAYNELDVALYLLALLQEKAKPQLQERFHIKETDMSPQEMLAYISKQMGHFIKGGETDPDKTARTLLQEFRKGRLAHISLD